MLKFRCYLYILGVVVTIILIWGLFLKNIPINTSYFRLSLKNIPNNSSKNLRKTVFQRSKIFAKCKNGSRSAENILYVKTQKTGSTTWKTVLFAYSEKYHLQLCMDATDEFHMNWPYQLDPYKLTHYYKDKCNIIADEMIYNEHIINNVMNENPFYLTSVRDPVQHFLSLYKFAHIHQVVEMFIGKKVKRWHGIELYLKHHYLIQNYWITLESNFTLVAMLKKNLQLYNFGLDTENPNFSEICRMASKIDHFIIADNSTASLVILRQKLCCEMHDLYYVRQNVFRKQSEVNEPTPKHIEKKILEFNSGDVMLYNIAKKRLLADIKAYGDEFSKDFLSFETGLKAYTQFCKGDQSKKLPYEKKCFADYLIVFKNKQMQLKKELVEKLKLEYQKRSLN